MEFAEARMKKRIHLGKATESKSFHRKKNRGDAGAGVIVGTPISLFNPRRHCPGPGRHSAERRRHTAGILHRAVGPGAASLGRDGGPTTGDSFFCVDSSCEQGQLFP